MSPPLVVMITRDPLNNPNAKSIHVFEVFRHLSMTLPALLLVPEVNESLYSHPRIRVVPHINGRFKLLNNISFQASLFVQLAYLVRWGRRLRPPREFVLYVRQSVFFPSPLLFSWLYRVPLVLEVNGAAELEMRLHRIRSFFLFIWVVYWVLRAYYNLSRKIVAVTMQLKRYLSMTHHLPEEKIVVVENGTNSDLFKPLDRKRARKKLYFPPEWEDRKIIGFVGNMEPWQGLEMLLKAAKLVVQQQPNVLFLLVGDGRLRSKLEKMVQHNNLQSYFFFTGFVPYHEVPLYINSCDVMVAPFVGKTDVKDGVYGSTSFESSITDSAQLTKQRIASPLKVFDSLSCERPIITAALPNLRFIEKHHCGFLVPMKDPIHLARALLKVLSMPSNHLQSLGKSGRKFVLKYREWKVSARKIVELILDIQ